MSDVDAAWHRLCSWVDGKATRIEGTKHQTCWQFTDESECIELIEKVLAAWGTYNIEEPGKRYRHLSGLKGFIPDTERHRLEKIMSFSFFQSYLRQLQKLIDDVQEEDKDKKE
jgi:hypothetical protein